MSVKFLKAGTGDCILIQHSGQNILIDGGNDFTYLRSEVLKICEAGEKIDLLFITHHDDDHIAGIIDLLNMVLNGDLPNDFVSKVIFNSPGKVRENVDDTLNMLSYKQAHTVEALIKAIGCEWSGIDEQDDPIELQDLKLTILSPVKSDLKDYSEQRGAYLTGDFKCDWSSPMSALEKFIDDASLDRSLPNRTSIIILAELAGKKILLTGDCTPERFEAALNRLLPEGKSVVQLDLVKLPHHASYRSLTKEIVTKINCSTFVICTNSKKHFLPNKRALLKILLGKKKTERETEFLFNYEEALNALKITAQEKQNYRIKLTRNNQSYGISI